MSQVSDPNADVERVDLQSLDVAEQKRQELLRLFPEVRTEGGKVDFDRLTPWTTCGEAATEQTAKESQQVTQKSRRSSRSPTTSRHSHVTVCFCRARHPPVNC